jgi:hypothetical protein
MKGKIREGFMNTLNINTKEDYRKVKVFSKTVIKQQALNMFG